MFTLGFVSTPEPVPTTLDVMAGATGMIFVALTIGYLPALYSEVKHREQLVKQLEGWIGKPAWGPDVLAELTLAGAADRLPELYRSWDGWCAAVAASHMKYPVLTHFRLPRSGTHFVTSLLAVMDAAALDMCLHPKTSNHEARLLLRQGASCLRDVAYPMRRVEPEQPSPGIGRSDFDRALQRLKEAGIEPEASAETVWEQFAALRSTYAPVAIELAFWTLAAPAPWSGTRAGFPDLLVETDPASA